MDIDKISIGDDVPNALNVLIEIPAQYVPVKYEIDKHSGAVVVDRFMAAPMFYPANYGFVPHTLADDGDPLDVLVVTPVPLVQGCVIAVRPVGMLNMRDEEGEDHKIIAVPAGKLCREYEHIMEYTDLPNMLIQQIGHFFEFYKKLEPGKWVEINSWEGSEVAKNMVMESIESYNKLES